MNKVIELLENEAKELDMEFKKAGIEGRNTPQEIADRRENIIRTFFKKYYPFPYRIVKGNICDSYGNESMSVDNVILNPIHPHTIDSKTNCASVILADGVDFAIECKSDLTSKVEIERVLKQCISVKKLKKVTTGVWGTTAEEHDYHVPYIIWANKSYDNIDILLNSIAEYYSDNKVEQLFQFDIIYISNKYLIFNIGNNSLGGVKKYLPGFYYCECDEDGLAMLLWAMSNFIGAAPSKKNIISYYTFLEKDIKYNEECNKLLGNI